MISIPAVGFSDLKSLQELSRITFSEAFAESNTDADMQEYLSVNFSLDKLSVELTEAESLFFIAWDGIKAVGYLKVNIAQAQTDLKETHSLEISGFTY